MNWSARGRRGRRPPKEGKRPWTFDDVEECCYREEIELVVVPMKQPGFFRHYDGRPTIVLSSLLRGIKKTFVGLHELGHYFSDTPETALYMPDSSSKREYAANRFAVCQMIPERMMLRMVAQRTLWALEEELGYEPSDFGSKLLEMRLQVYARSPILNWSCE